MSLVVPRDGIYILGLLWMFDILDVCILKSYGIIESYCNNIPPSPYPTWTPNDVYIMFARLYQLARHRRGYYPGTRRAPFAYICSQIGRQSRL
jgi:hypothetical protein